MAAPRCWQHSLQVVASLKATPPADQLIVLFGGSRVRECTVSDRDWTEQLCAETGRLLVAHNLGASNRTFAEDLAVLEHLPPVPTMVLIGVDVGRFTKPQTARPVRLPLPRPVPAGYEQHRYDAAGPLGDAHKRELADTWLERRLSLFESNLAVNRRSLACLVAACLERGLYPALVTTPLNVAAVGDRFNKPQRACWAACCEVSCAYGVPFIDPGVDAQLESADFHVIFHLVTSGYVKWQVRLTLETARLLCG